MFTKLLTLSALFVSAFCLSIRTVSERNVIKRDANAEDLFPDWVPFKNKHGDELGEFVQVTKNKVKKRLAPPINFLLRAVAEPEGEDYYDKGAGAENDAEDYYEKKEWTDVHRPAESVEKHPVLVNHSDISDIDGVVSIITKKPRTPIIQDIYDTNLLKSNQRQTLPDKELEQVEMTEKEQLETESVTTESTNAHTTEPFVYRATEPLHQSAKNNLGLLPGESEPLITDQDEKKRYLNNEEEDDEEEEPKKSDKSSQEEKENEARKAKILSSVDELKERHAEEQRELAEKNKGEDMFKDEFGKVQTRDDTPDRFLGKSSEESTERPERYRKLRRRKPTTKPDYDEYEDLGKNLEDKYKINVLKPDPDAISTETSKRRNLTTNIGRQKDVRLESGKVSVFKNPHLFMMYDDNDDPPPDYDKKINASIRGPKKFSSKYTTSNPVSSDERISLIPADSKEGEPTMFFPKIRKNKKKKVKTTTPATDSTVAETVTDNYKETTAYDVTAPDVERNSTEVLATETAAAEDADTTGTDTVSVKADAVTDAIPEPSDHKKEHHKAENYNKEKGGGREHHNEHSEEHEEHGKKAYEGHHEDKKAAKGHHDKENHLGKYDDHGGVHKHHSEESGHYGGHHHEEHGKKQAKYEESGKHSKGHSTKGSHDIHKKEEYEKKVEFFEEEGDSSEEEKHGGYHHDRGHSEGGRFKKGDLKSGHHHQQKGDAGHFDRGGHHHVNKGHKQSSGHDSHGHHGAKHFHKEGKDGGRKWIYHHGTPAKTANLVVIDRRGEQFYHGPHYYG